MSGLDTLADDRGHGAATRALVFDSGMIASTPIRRLDDVWGPVVLRSGLVVAGFVLLLLSLGVLLLDVAMNPYPRLAHRPDRAAVSPTGEVTRVAGRYAGASFELSQR